MSPEGSYPVGEMQSFLAIDIFPEGNNFLILLQKKSVLECMFYFDKSNSQKKFLLIDTSTEEFYPVRENLIYNSLFPYPSAEGIFL